MILQQRYFILAFIKIFEKLLLKGDESFGDVVQSLLSNMTSKLGLHNDGEEAATYRINALGRFPYKDSKSCYNRFALSELEKGILYFLVNCIMETFI